MGPVETTCINLTASPLQTLQLLSYVCHRSVTVCSVQVNTSVHGYGGCLRAHRRLSMLSAVLCKTEGSWRSSQKAC